MAARLTVIYYTSTYTQYSTPLMYIWVGGKCLCWPLNMLHLLEAEKPKYAFLFYSISPLPLDGSNGPNQRIYIQSWACVSEMLSRLCAFFKWCRFLCAHFHCKISRIFCFASSRLRFYFAHFRAPTHHKLSAVKTCFFVLDYL